MAKTIALRVRIEERHMRILDAMAKAVGVPVADVVRMLIDNSTVLHVPVPTSHVELMEKERSGQ